MQRGLRLCEAPWLCHNSLYHCNLGFELIQASFSPWKIFEIFQLLISYVPPSGILANINYSLL